MTPSRLALLAQLSVLLAAPLAQAEDTSPEEATQQAAAPALKILRASVEGELCPSGSGVASISGDGEAITVTFSSLEASTETSGQSDGQCRVRLELDVPHGYSFSGLGVAASGYYFSTGQGRANFAMNYSFPANGAGQRFTHNRLRGDSEYVFRHVADRMWSPCGSANKPVVMYLDLSLATSGTAYINVSAIDADVALDSQLAWRTCQPR